MKYTEFVDYVDVMESFNIPTHAKYSKLCRERRDLILLGDVFSFPMGKSLTSYEPEYRVWVLHRESPALRPESKTMVVEGVETQIANDIPLPKEWRPATSTLLTFLEVGDTFVMDYYEANSRLRPHKKFGFVVSLKCSKTSNDCLVTVTAPYDPPQQSKTCRLAEIERPIWIEYCRRTGHDLKDVLPFKDVAGLQKKSRAMVAKFRASKEGKELIRKAEDAFYRDMFESCGMEYPEKSMKKIAAMPKVAKKYDTGLSYNLTLTHTHINDSEVSAGLSSRHDVELELRKNNFFITGTGCGPDGADISFKGGRRSEAEIHLTIKGIVGSEYRLTVVSD